MLCPSQNAAVRALHRSFCVVVAAIAIASFASIPLEAQVTSGTISGTVTDSSSAIVKAATVTISNPATGVTRTVSTSDSGEFVAPGLLPGTYNIVVEAKGFKKSETSGFVLSAADKLNAGQIVLQVGTTNEEVTVTADTGQIQLQSNSGERSDIITSKQLNDVAMNGRNVLDYMKLVPGMVGLPDLHRSGTGSVGSFSINGTRQNQHEFTVDGASNVDTGDNNGTHVTINTDAIEEVKVLTSNYQAEFGKAAGGQIALSTKSGTNAWHGNARFFHRHEGFNANEYFNIQSELGNGSPNTRPLYRYNDIGYQLGGPVKKDKLFFFWSQEFFRQLVPLGTIQFYTPTAAERVGDFSKSTDDQLNPVAISGPGITNNVINENDPNFPAALVPVFDQIKKILALYPSPNVKGFGVVKGQTFNYSQNLSGTAPRREDILRVDLQLNSKHRLYGRWAYNAEDANSPFVASGSGPFGTFACDSTITFKGGCTQHHPGWNLSANLVSTITPTILNEFSIGPSHTLSINKPVTNSISRGANGITLPLYFPVNNDQAIPDLSFSGLGNVDFQGGYLGATPWQQANTTINVNDNLSWVRGRHTIKTGMFYQRSRKDQIAWGNVNGQFNFQSGPYSFGTANYSLFDPLAAALLGFFEGGGNGGFYQYKTRPIGFFRYNQLEFYVQDTWKATSRLTLDYGLRFAWIPPQYDAKNQIAIFDPKSYKQSTAVTIDPSTGNIVPGSGDPLDGMRYVANGQLPEGGWGSRGIMPEPRLGFAYDLLSNHKTVLRGGIGMMHDRVQGNLIFNPVFDNPLINPTVSIPSGNIANMQSLQQIFPVTVDKNIIAAERSGKVPTVYSFSLGIQHEITSGTTLDLAYVGSVSRHLATVTNLNAVPYGYAFTAAAQDPNNFAGGVVPAVEPNLPAIYAAAGFNFSGAYAYGHQGYTNAALVPYKGYGQIAGIGWGGTVNYNSLQASLQRRFSKGLTGGLVYTWSKALTTSSSESDYQDPVNPAIGYRAASWDRTHVIAANYVYDLPNLSHGARWLSYLTDHYQLSGVTNLMSGAPAQSVAGYQGVDNNWGWNTGSLDGSNMWGTLPYFFSLDSSGNLATPTVGLPSRASRDILRGGGMQNWDMSLFKNIPIRERYSIQLRLEGYNIFNHPNFQNRYYNVNSNGPFQWYYPGTAGDPMPSWCGSGNGPCVTQFTASKASNWGAPRDTYNSSGGPGGFRVVQLGAKFIF